MGGISLKKSNREEPEETSKKFAGTNYCKSNDCDDCKHYDECVENNEEYYVNLNEKLNSNVIPYVENIRKNATLHLFAMPFLTRLLGVAVLGFGIAAIIKIGWIIGCVIILNSFIVFTLVSFLSKILELSNNSHLFNAVVHKKLEEHAAYQDIFEKIVIADNKKKWKKS
jgi:ABC-type bacteriocin/lantibiotic exporter with double-glycine peptidase domain